MNSQFNAEKKNFLVPFTVRRIGSEGFMTSSRNVNADTEEEAQVLAKSILERDWPAAKGFECVVKTIRIRWS